MRILFDENIPPFYQEQMRTRLSEEVFLRVGEPDTLASGTSDPALLRWCEANNCLLVTADRASMPEHFTRHLSRGGHIPGILVVRPRAKVTDIFDALELLLTLATVEELRDQYIYIPL